jgi:enoyl-CoA hydratase
VGYEFITVDVEPPIATVTLNRPKVLNALSPELIAEVSQALRELDADERVRAVVLTGGAKVFAAGADIGDMADRTAVEQLNRDQTGRWAVIAGFTKPLIAAVNGYALGGGCELALMCDMIVAGDSARLGQPEINLGIIPGAGGTQRWPRTAGKYAAMETVLTGTPITAARAKELQARRAPAGGEGSTGSADGQGGGAQSIRVAARRRTRGGTQELLLPVLH